MAKLLGHDIVTNAELEELKNSFIAPFDTRMKALENKLNKKLRYYQIALIVAAVVVLVVCLR